MLKLTFSISVEMSCGLEKSKIGGKLYELDMITVGNCNKGAMTIFEFFSLTQIIIL